jgi:hypothetical protein
MSTSSEISSSVSKEVFSLWDDAQMMDILRYHVASNTWRWQDCRNMRLVCRRWRSAVLLPQLFLDNVTSKEELDDAVARASFIRALYGSTQVALHNLGPALLHNRTVTRLLIQGLELTDELIHSLAPAVAANKTLQRLEIHKMFSSAHVATIASSLIQNTSLTKIKLGECNLNAVALTTFARALNENPMPRHISLPNASPIHIDCVEHMSAFLRSPSLTALSLVSFSFGDALTQDPDRCMTATMFGDAILKSSSLKSLNLSHGSGPGRFRMFARIVGEPNSVESLNLDRNEFTEDPDTDILIEAIAKTSHVKILKLRRTAILGSQYLNNLRVGLESHQNTVLQKLYLEGNNLWDQGVIYVTMMLNTNPSIKYISITRNGITTRLITELLAPYVNSKRLVFAQTQ